MNHSLMVNLRQIGQLARLRLLLLMRQKIGWLSLLVGIGLVLLSVVVANVSFAKPEKIFWDFSLGMHFVFLCGLAVYLGSQIFYDESDRRTLHLLLCNGVSRIAWVLGNGLGIWLGLFIIQCFWFGVSVLCSIVGYDLSDCLIQAQAEWLLSLEILLIVFMSMLLSLFMRSILALIGSAVLVVLMHSSDTLEQILTDPQVGRYIEDRSVSWVMMAMRFLPPLEWLDIKSFVGYVSSVSTNYLGGMTLLALLWTLLIAVVTWLRFERMDL